MRPRCKFPIRISNSQENDSTFRHGRAWSRPSTSFPATKAWMPGIADKFTQSARARLLWPGMTSLAAKRQIQIQLRSLAARCARVVHELSPNRGRRECRAPGAPAAARGVVVNTRVSHHGHTGNTRHSPRNGFNGFLRALPGDRACLPPSSADQPANLTPASGRQDHTTSPSTSSAIRQRRISVHRIPPRVRDDREPPLCGTGRRAIWT